jgi:hypothetical protein
MAKVFRFHTDINNTIEIGKGNCTVYEKNTWWTFQVDGAKFFKRNNL